VESWDEMNLMLMGPSTDAQACANNTVIQQLSRVFAVLDTATGKRQFTSPNL
jgi:hypothetical protein